MIGFFIAILDVTASSLATCHPPPEGSTEAIKSQYAQNCSYIQGPLLISFEWLVNFMDENEGFFVGLFTAGLVAYTAALSRSTDKLWKETRDSAARQEMDTRILQRAYISVGIGGISPYRRDDRSRHIVVAHIDIENGGNLPARNVEWAMQTTFSATDDLDPAEVPTVEQFFGKNIVTPKTSRRQGTYAFDMTGVAGWVYIWGRVRYKDGFELRTTHYCHRYPCRMLEKMAKDGYGILPIYGRYHQNGNDAD